MHFWLSMAAILLMLVLGLVLHWYGRAVRRMVRISRDREWLYDTSELLERRTD